MLGISPRRWCWETLVQAIHFSQRFLSIYVEAMQQVLCNDVWAVCKVINIVE
jgi:hypothetical protein